MQQAYVLPNLIVALQIGADCDGAPRLGLLTQLPKDAQIQICGDGFDDRTVKIRSGEGTYYAFRQDIPILARSMS